MDVDEIRGYCLDFPDATENLQWGDDLCFKIRGKIFATLALTTVPQKVCFKCIPETFAELVEREDIRPAPYVGRYKWVILDRPDALGRKELQNFIRQSYEMVAAKAPGNAKSRRAPSKTNAPKKKSARARKRNKRH